jgi:hypothetical protein
VHHGGIGKPEESGVSVEQNPDLWQQLETYTAQWRSAYKRLDDALNRLDPTAERESKAELEDLFANVRLILEGLQTLHPEDRKIRDALERFDRWQEQSRRPPRVLSAADARRMLERLEKMTSPAMPQPAADVPERKKRGRPPRIPDDRKEQAQRAKTKGKSNRKCAEILYGTKHVTDRQVRNVPSILKHYAKKHSHDSEDRPTDSKE